MFVVGSELCVKGGEIVGGDVELGRDLGTGRREVRNWKEREAKVGIAARRLIVCICLLEGSSTAGEYVWGGMFVIGVAGGKGRVMWRLRRRVNWKVVALESGN